MGASQSQKARGKLSPRDGILYQTSIRLPLANQDFLGFWMDYICWEGRSQRSALQRKHTGRRSHCTPRKPSGWDREGDKMHRLPEESVLAKYLVA